MVSLNGLKNGLFNTIELINDDGSTSNIKELFGTNITPLSNLVVDTLQCSNIYTKSYIDSIITPIDPSNNNISIDYGNQYSINTSNDGANYKLNFNFMDDIGVSPTDDLLNLVNINRNINSGQISLNVNNTNVIDEINLKRNISNSYDIVTTDVLINGKQNILNGLYNNITVLSILTPTLISTNLTVSSILNTSILNISNNIIKKTIVGGLSPLDITVDNSFRLILNPSTVKMILDPTLGFTMNDNVDIPLHQLSVKTLNVLTNVVALPGYYSSPQVDNLLKINQYLQPYINLRCISDLNGGVAPRASTITCFGKCPIENIILTRNSTTLIYTFVLSVPFPNGINHNIHATHYTPSSVTVGFFHPLTVSIASATQFSVWCRDSLNNKYDASFYLTSSP